MSKTKKTYLSRVDAFEIVRHIDDDQSVLAQFNISELTDYLNRHFGPEIDFTISQIRGLCKDFGFEPARHYSNSNGKGKGKAQCSKADIQLAAAIVQITAHLQISLTNHREINAILGNAEKAGISNPGALKLIG